MKDPPKPGFHNARLETVATKPSFRSAFTKRRALVPMNGYYDWVERAGKKQPYFIHGDGMLSAAGLYVVTKNDAGNWTATYTIITTEAQILVLGVEVGRAGRRRPLRWRHHRVEPADRHPVVDRQKVRGARTSPQADLVLSDRHQMKPQRGALARGDPRRRR